MNVLSYDMDAPILVLDVLAEPLAVCRLAPHSAIPEWAPAGDFLCLVRTPEELSVVCPERCVPPGHTPCERGWQGLRLVGPLDFSLTGILASVAVPLAAAGISIFAVSTYDTDYVLVKTAQLDQAVAALTSHGHTVRNRAVSS